MKTLKPQGFVATYKRDIALTRKRVAVIQRRVDALEDRLRSYRGERTGRIKMEIACYKWLLNTVIPEWIAGDPLIEADWCGTRFTDNATHQDITDLLGTEVMYHGERYEIQGSRFLHGTFRPVVRLTLRPLGSDEVPQNDGSAIDFDLIGAGSVYRRVHRAVSR